MADMSTNQPSAVRPNHGPTADRAKQNRIARYGVPYFGCSAAYRAGMYPSRAIEYSSRDVAVRNPRIPVRIADAMATPSTTSPGLPISASTAAPTAQSCRWMNAVQSGEAAAVTRLLHE